MSDLVCFESDVPVWVKVLLDGQGDILEANSFSKVFTMDLQGRWRRSDWVKGGSENGLRRIVSSRENVMVTFNNSALSRYVCL
jgi:hypothetical protein